MTEVIMKATCLLGFCAVCFGKKKTDVSGVLISSIIYFYGNTRGNQSFPVKCLLFITAIITVLHLSS